MLGVGFEPTHTIQSNNSHWPVDKSIGSRCMCWVSSKFVRVACFVKKISYYFFMLLILHSTVTNCFSLVYCQGIGGAKKGDGPSKFLGADCSIKVHSLMCVR